MRECESREGKREDYYIVGRNIEVGRAVKGKA